MTWTEHSNHNIEQLLAMYKKLYRPNTHGILQSISTRLGLFWDDFPKISSETWSHPPTSIVISDFWGKNSLQSPLVGFLSLRYEYSNALHYSLFHSKRSIAVIGMYEILFNSITAIPFIICYRATCCKGDTAAKRYSVCALIITLAISLDVQ